MPSPFFTIITATRNAADSLPRLLDSLAGQSCRDFELVLQDGASGDATVSVAEHYSERLPAILVTSEQDRGIYDAWNKAMHRVRGEWVLFLGADDILADDAVLAHAQETISGFGKEVDFSAGDVLMCGPDGKGMRRFLADLCGGVAALRQDMPFPHSGLFIRKTLLEAHSFNVSFRIAGDYEFLCRTWKKNEQARSLNFIVTHMGWGGISSHPGNIFYMRWEYARAASSCFAHVWNLRRISGLVQGGLIMGLSTLLGPRRTRALLDRLKLLQARLTTMKTKYGDSTGGRPLGADIPARAVRWPDSSPPPRLRADGGSCFSLLVATLGRRESLANLLKSLDTQSYRNFEVLIADQNPPGMLDAVLAPFASTLRVQRVPVSNKGVSQARNALLPLAQGDIIAFPDDDCWYAPHTLERVAQLFSENPGMGGLLAAWSELSLEQIQSNPRLTLVGACDAFRDAGTLAQFYRKEAIEGLLFDSELGPGTGLPYGCGEDTDFLLQVLGKGHCVMRIPEVLVFHPRPDMDDPRLPQKAHAYGHGRMHLLRKHKFPLWFKLATVLYPLACVPLEGRRAWQYRKAMFLGRLSGLLSK